MRPQILSPLLCLLLLTGCASAPPPDLFVLTPQLLQQRQVETRRYEGIDRRNLLVAAANVLQDMEYTIDNSETSLGLITASKQRGPTPGPGNVQISTAIMIGAFGLGMHPPVNEEETLRVSLVVRPLLDGAGQAVPDQHLVRVTFQRLIERSDLSFSATTLRDPRVYQAFFDRLSKSIFLEAHSL
ncbi:MAG: hypothetical protein ACOX5Z_01220 [Desulfobulbus sp.]|jgi:hypothetical protein